jgi:hypothetical protein
VLISPDQSRAVFAPTGPGQWQNTTEPVLQGAVLTQLAGDFVFQIRLKDGTVQRFERIFGFANLAGLAAITDRNGNTVTLTREQVFQQNRITQITEPAGVVSRLVWKRKWRILPVEEVNHQPAACQGGHRRNAPWARVSGSPSGCMRSNRQRLGS